MMKKIYLTPFTGSLKLECPAYTCRPTISDAVDPQAPERFSGTKKPINVMYI